MVLRPVLYVAPSPLLPLHGMYDLSLQTSSDCMDVPQATDFPVQDDQISTSTASVAASSSTSSTPNLPAGWDRNSREDSMTGMILALSLSLAVALIIFMMGVVRWRQKRRTRHKPDAEKTPSSAQDGASVEESEEVRRARTQQRLWARASAKWVANVRQAARRRRKRMASGTVAKDSDGRVLREAQASTSAVSLARTHNANNLDRRQSTTSSLRSSRWTRTSSRSPSPAPSHRSRNHDDVSSPPPSHSSQSPPAYPQTSTYQHGRWHSHPLDSAAGSHHHASDIPPPPASPPPHSPIPYEPPLHSAHVAIDDKSVLARMAHLASAPPLSTSEDMDVDADMHACGPSSPGGPGRSSELRPSVPVLEDDPFEDALPPDIESPFTTRDEHTNRWPGPGFAAARSGAPHDPFPARPHAHGPALDSLELSSMPMRHHARAMDAPAADVDSGEDGEVPSYAEDVRLHPPLVLPPPPTKVAPMFYEYPDEFERDVATAEPVMGPSAPPFEYEEYAHLPEPPLEHASVLFSATAMATAPPLDSVDALSVLLPSAPPLSFDEDDSDGPSHGQGEAPHSAPDDGGIDGGDAQLSSAPPDDHGDDGANPGAPAGTRNPNPNPNSNPDPQTGPGVRRESLDEGPGGRVARSELAVAPPRYLP
ncbi:hypothetical protein GY45DRAFT_470297 [Cubamyces sp. BRFM 1775]|nr:hypothetical protein GY45DRAFT_470297 [Cubamyces sp. BRFM 1775]